MKGKLLFKDQKINFKTTINILLLIMVISGFFGFVYETIFYRIDLGYFVKRGSTFGPWIPIYAFGGLLITIFTYKLKNKPFVLFLVNCFITGFLEYCSGLVLDRFFGKRLWDYNTEIWNFGNINGYICLRSILFFGFSSLLLIYVIIPSLINICKKIPERGLSIISLLLWLIFVADMIIYAIIK